jgi:hypothetical protein
MTLPWNNDVLGSQATDTSSVIDVFQRTYTTFDATLYTEHYYFDAKWPICHQSSTMRKFAASPVRQFHARDSPFARDILTRFVGLFYPTALHVRFPCGDLEPSLVGLHNIDGNVLIYD